MRAANFVIRARVLGGVVGHMPFAIGSRLAQVTGFLVIFGSSLKVLGDAINTRVVQISQRQESGGVRFLCCAVQNSRASRLSLTPPPKVNRL